MEAEATDIPPVAPRPLRRRVRAIGTTIGFVLASAVLEFMVGFLALSLRLPIPDNGNGQLIGVVLFLIVLLLPVAPAAMGGMYWLALRELRRSRVRVVWLEVAGAGIAFFLVTGVLTNMVDIMAGRIIYATNYYTLDQRLSTMLIEIVHDPYVILVALALALFFAVVIVNIARFFTNQRLPESASAPQQRWRDLAIIWGLTTFITFVCSISQLVLSTYLETISGSQGGSFSFFIALILVIYPIIPTSIVAAIACADALRLLYTSVPTPIPVAHEDPFASSDGSFILSVSRIGEHE